MTNLDSIFKSRDITLPTKVPLVKGKGPQLPELKLKLYFAYVAFFLTGLANFF